MGLSDLLWEENPVARLGDELGDWHDFFLKLQELCSLGSLLSLFVSNCVAASCYIEGNVDFLL